MYPQLIFYLLLVSVHQCCTQGSVLDGYKWRHVVEEKLQGVTETCLRGFVQCYTEYTNASAIPAEMTFDGLLRNGSSTRMEMCTLARDDYLYCPIEIQKACEFEEYRTVLYNFLCYPFNLSDSTVPPVSILCAVKYWYCSWMGKRFTRRTINGTTRAHFGKESVSEKWNPYDKCFEGKETCMKQVWKNQHSFLGKHYYCHVSQEVCRLDNYNGLFKAMLELRHLEEQHYFCGRLEECLITPYTFTFWDEHGIVENACTKSEAALADQTMCSNTSFTPDIVGTVLVSDLCRKIFNRDFNVNLPDLKDDAVGRRSLCESRYLKGGNDWQLEGCDVIDVVTISNFLCYDARQNDSIIYITSECRYRLNRCLGVQDVTYLEMAGYEQSGQDMTSLKHDWCHGNASSELKNCLQSDQFGVLKCSEREQGYILNTLCPTDNSTNGMDSTSNGMDSTLRGLSHMKTYSLLGLVLLVRGWY